MPEAFDPTLAVAQARTRNALHNVARSVDGLRPGDGVHESPVDRERLLALCEGQTG